MPGYCTVNFQLEHYFRLLFMSLADSLLYYEQGQA
ncbi:hypothetical protein EMIT0P228_20602 [Pseudomonas brassicacearum]